METIGEQIIRHEGGVVLKPYRCTAGKLTIGVGHNLDDRGITKEEAMFIFNNDLQTCRKELAPFIPVTIPLESIRHGVLLNMCFNLGINRLLRFKKMFKAIAVGDFEEASVQMLDSSWHKQVGYRAKELAQQMRTGEMA